MSGALARRLVPDDLWELLEPLIPPPRTRPQGGGRSRADDRAVFSAIAFVLTSGCPWRALPSVFGVKPPTVHRRFGEWAALGLWQRLWETSIACYGEGPEVEWTRALAEAVESRMGPGPISALSGTSQSALLRSMAPDSLVRW
jgi:transposase